MTALSEYKSEVCPFLSVTILTDFIWWTTIPCLGTTTEEVIREVVALQKKIKNGWLALCPLILYNSALQAPK